MKNRVICSQLELIHISDIEKMETNLVEVKPEKKFLQLILEGKAEYSSQSQQTSAGTVLNETVKAKIKYGSDLYFIDSPLKYYVLRLHTDSGSFLVGSLDYPVELTYNENKVYINLTFKSSKPI